MRAHLSPNDVAAAAVAATVGTPTPETEATLTRLRESVYQVGGASGDDAIGVWYEDPSILEDIQDLSTILDENLATGSPNLENAQVREITTALQSGHGLANAQIGQLKSLLAKYAEQITALRARPGKDGQDYTDVPDPATARIVDAPDTLAESATGFTPEELANLGMVGSIRKTTPPAKPASGEELERQLAEDDIPMVAKGTGAAPTSPPKHWLPNELEDALIEHDLNMPDERLGLRDPS